METIDGPYRGLDHRRRSLCMLQLTAPLALREGTGVSPLTALIAALSAAAGVSACYTVNL